jgi:hypothetical protein
VAQVAFHGDGAHAGHPVEQRADASGAGGAGAIGVLALAGISSGRLPENSIAPNGQAMPHSLQLTHRLSFSWTAPSTRLMALTGQTAAQGRLRSGGTSAAPILFHYA